MRRAALSPLTIAIVVVATAMLWSGRGTSMADPLPTPSPGMHRTHPRHAHPMPSPTETPEAYPTPAALPSTGPTPQPYQPSMENLPPPAPIGLPAPAYVPSDVPNGPLTLDEAIRVALVHQANITVAVASVMAAQGNTMVVRAAELPSISVGAGGSSAVSASAPHASSAASGLLPTSGAQSSSASNVTSILAATSSGYVANGTLKQLLYDFNHTRNLVHQAIALERSAFGALSKAQQDLVLAVKQGYFQYVQNIRLIDVQASNVKDQRTHLELALARYRAGIGLPSDVVLAQASVADAIFNLNQAQNTAGVSRVNLAIQLGIDPRTPIDLVMDESEKPIDTSDADALFTTALKLRPEVLVAVANLQAAQYALSAARTGNAPQFNATASYLGRGGGINAINNDTVTLGVQLNWPIFDAGITAGQIKTAKANELTMQANLVLARQGVMSDVAQNFLNVKLAEQRVVDAAAEVRNAEESERLVAGRYKAGLATIVDLLDAQTLLVTGQTNQVNAISAVDQARAALAHAMGLPLPWVKDAGTAVPPRPSLDIPVRYTEQGQASPKAMPPKPTSPAPGAPAALPMHVAPPPKTIIWPPESPPPTLPPYFQGLRSECGGRSPGAHSARKHADPTASSGGQPKTSVPDRAAP